MLEMAHSDLTSAETDQLVENMFVSAELDKHGVLTMEDFMKVMAGEQNMMWDVCLDWKGTYGLCITHPDRLSRHLSNIKVIFLANTCHKLRCED